MRRDIEIDLSRPVTLAEIPGLSSSFAGWLRDELVSLLPGRWRRAAGAEVKRPTVYVSPGQGFAQALDVEVRVDDGDTGAIARSGLVDVWIDPALVLQRTVTLPDMPMHHLRSAIGLQIDELTPFKPADVVFDCCIVRRDGAAQKCVVDIAVMPRRVLSVALNKAGLDASHAGRIGVRSAPGDGAQFRFVLDENPTRLRGAGLRWTLTILAIVAGPYAVVWAWETASERERRALASQIQTLRPEAEAARQAIAQFRAMEAPVMALSSANEPSGPLAVLAAFSRLNPDTVTLVKLDIENGNVQLTGLAKNASAFLELLEKSPEFESVGFSSPVSAAQTPGMERFSLTLKISRRLK